MIQMLRQTQAVRFFACLIGILLLCSLAACGPVNSDSPVNLSTPTANESVPEPVASYPAAILTGVVLEPAEEGNPTLPPATVQALAAAAATNAAIRQATEISVFATYDVVARAEQTITSVAVRRQEATQYAVETQVVQAAKTAFAAQTGPGATVVPPGQWGGVGIEVRVLTDTVHVKFPCDYGTAYVPLTLEASGAFNLPGVFYPYWSHPDLHAHFQGQVTGSQLTLTVLWGDDGKLNTKGPFTATLGQTPDWEGYCPIYLAGNTLIDTPSGSMPVKDLREGMLVWTESNDGVSGTSGARQIATVLETSQTKVPPGHEMVRLVLADGHELLASPAHPMADGRPLGTLSTGDLIDGTRVVNAERVSYDEDFTYDILPSGGTGTYWANGILIGSTLAESATGP